MRVCMCARVKRVHRSGRLRSRACRGPELGSVPESRERAGLPCGWEAGGKGSGGPGGPSSQGGGARGGEGGRASVHPTGVRPAAACCACPGLEENRPSQPPPVRTQLWGRGRACQPGPLVCVMPRVRSALALALTVGVGRWEAWTRSGLGSALDREVCPASGQRATGRWVCCRLKGGAVGISAG